MLSVHKIRPSTGQSSVSTSNLGQSTSEGSDLRRPYGDKVTSSGSSISSRSRKVPKSVTSNACLNCKKARAKCDGNKPCRRCTARVKISECIYEVRIKEAKAELLKQIRELRAKNHVIERILKALSTDEKEPQILERLKAGDTYESIGEWLGHSSTVDFETLSSHKSMYTTSGADVGDVESSKSS